MDIKPFRKRRNFLQRVVLETLFLAAFAFHLFAAPTSQVWIVSWAASQQSLEAQNALPSEDLRDATIRQIFHLSAGGSTVRVHMSNAFGTAPLHVTAVHIARPRSTASDAIVPASDRALTFSGSPDVTIPPGAEYVSDAIEYSVAALSDLAITYHLDVEPWPGTGHLGSRATSYIAHGELLGAANLPDTKGINHWYQVSGIDVQAPNEAGSIVALGDSITDGLGSRMNENNRWTDVLARRLQESGQTELVGVSNQGIGGNHLLTDGIGPNALARFDRDVLGQAGVRWLIVLEGVNDLGGLTRLGEVPKLEHATRVERVLAAYQQIVARAHAHGIRAIGATITPFVGSDYYHPGPLTEADRQAVNRWIRTGGYFDAVIDFDAVVRDPGQPNRLAPNFDSGDHLHPSPAGYKAMGDSIPLSLFTH